MEMVYFQTFVLRAIFKIKDENPLFFHKNTLINQNKSIIRILKQIYINPDFSMTSIIKLEINFTGKFLTPLANILECSELLKITLI